jgi:hypothetical protein
MAVTPVLRRLGQEDSKFKASLDNIATPPSQSPATAKINK